MVPQRMVASYRERERESIKLSIGATSVHHLCVCMKDCITLSADVVCVCICRPYTGGTYVTDKHSKLCSLGSAPHILTTTPL